MGIQIVKFPAILTGFVFISVFIVVTQAQLKLQIKPSLSVTDSVLNFPNEYEASKIERTKCRERAALIKLSPEAQAHAEGRENINRLRNGRISYDQALRQDVQASNYWSKEYIFNNSVYPFSIAQSSDFTYLIAGYLNWESRSRRSFILNIDSDGGIIWKNLYHDPSKVKKPLPNIYFPWLQIKSISPADDGGSFISGALVEESNIFIAVLAKISPSGDVEWSAYFKAGWFVTFDTLSQTNDGGLIISGKRNQDIWVVKMSSAGVIEWQYTYGGQGMESDFFDFPKSPSIIQANDGGYLLAGDSDSFSSNQWPDLWILKLSEKGDVEWQKNYGGLQSDYLAYPGHHIKETASGDIYVAATTISFSNPPQWDVWVLKLNNSGEIKWQKRYGDEQIQNANHITLTDNGGSLVGGNTRSGDETHMFLLKLNAQGSIIWQNSYRTQEINDLSTIYPLPNREYLVVGKSGFRRNVISVMRVSENGNLNNDCDIVSALDFTTSETSIQPLITHTLPKNTSVTVRNGNLAKAEFKLVMDVVCSDQVQPPINLSVDTQHNRGLFAGEAFNYLAWNPNPANSGFSVAEYKIYRKPADKGVSHYELIGTVSGSEFQYLDEAVDSNQGFDYVVTSVDAQGIESGLSEPASTK